MTEMRRFERRTNEYGKLSEDEKWILDNKVKLVFLCLENIKRLRGIEAKKNDNLKIIEFCRRVCVKYAYSLNETVLIDELNEAQSGDGFFTINELYYLKTFILCAAFDAISDDLEGKTRNVSHLAVKMIYDLDNIEFYDIYESVSATERILLADPSGVYADCDLATKELYRRKLTQTARKNGVSERELAKMYLELSEKSEGKGTHIGYHILKNAKHDRVNAYFVVIDFVPILVILPILTVAYIGSSALLILLSALPYFSVRRLVKLITNDFVNAVIPTEIPPRLQLKSIPQNAKTVLTYTVSLQNKASAKQLFDKILLYAHAYNDSELLFCALVDLPDSTNKIDSHDDEILEYAEKRVDEIRKFNPNCFLLHRERSYSESEEKYIGRERKRGAQEEMIAWLTDDASALTFYGGEKPKNVRYIFALDADTEIAYKDILRLTATALHPCNAPEFAVRGGAETVIDGYGIFVPTAAVSLKNISKQNKYTIVKNAFEGRGAYESANFSAYTSLCDEGTYCGKGLIDVNAYKRVVFGKFPSERILSHDISEGAFLRSAAVSDAFVYDSPPKNLISERKRLHRWIRGDLQSLCLARKYIFDCKGQKYKTPLADQQRRLIAEPVKEHLASAFRASAVVLSLLCGGVLGTLIYLLSISDLIYEFAKRFVASVRLPERRRLTGAADFRKAARFVDFSAFASIADSSYLASDALIRAYYRTEISHKHLLEWTVFGTSDTCNDTCKTYLHALKTSVFLGILSLIVAFYSKSALSPLLMLHGISWVIYPFYMARMNTAFFKQFKRDAKDSLRDDAAKMWRFFSDNVNEETNFLPPDNISYFPKKKTAYRTSPTNIGLYLMSVLNAFDFGFIGSDELWRRLTATLTSVHSLERYRGHLYNWYDIKNGSVLHPFYISTVDSGNLAVSLLTVKNGIKRLGALYSEPIRLIDALLSEMDFSFLYSAHRNLFSIGYDVSAGKPDPNFYDLYPSEMLTVSYYAVSAGQVPDAHFAALGRIFCDKSGISTMLSWSGTAFEYFMPSLWLPFEMMTERGEMLASAVEWQKLAAQTFEGVRIYGISESAYYDFDEEMNYSYKANGAPNLAMSRKSADDAVFSPYSLYLMLTADKDAASTLSKLKKTSLYGKYGFYEAVDMTPHRVGNEAAVIKQYMAHHVGMSIAATANYCFDDINVRRFTDDPAIAASEYLLYTKNEICRPASTGALHALPSDVQFEPYDAEDEITHSGAALISNGLVKISADDCGNVVFEAGEILLTRKRDGDVSGFGVLIRADGEIYNCLCGTEAGVKRSFSYNGASVTYRNEIIHGDGVIKTETVFTVDPESPSGAVGFTAEGSFSVIEAVFYAFPILNRERDYKSAPAYSDLFLTVSDSSDGVRFERRGKEGNGDALEFSFSPSPEKLVTDLQKLAVFPLGDDFAERIFDAREARSVGAAVHPFVAAEFAFTNENASFELMLSHGETPDAAHRDLSELLDGAKRRYRLFAAYSGADENAIRIAMRMYSSVSDNERKLTECTSLPQYRRDTLWRFGISGDLPIVVYYSDGKGTDASHCEFETLLRAKRFLFISGVRFDLVVFADDGGYANGEMTDIRLLIEKNGCAKLRSKNNGIFVIGKSIASENDEIVISALAACVLGCRDGKRKVLDHPLDRKEKISKPPIKHSAREFEFTENGVSITDGAHPSPWCAVYGNSAFGTMLTNKTAGFSWFRNSSLGIISRRHTDFSTGTPGERLILKTKTGSFDLLLCSSSVEYNTDSALYRGAADDVTYEVRVGTDAKLPAKLYHVKLETAKNADVTLSLSLYPDCRAVASKGRMRLLKDMSADVSIFSVTTHPNEDFEIFSDRITSSADATSSSVGFVVLAYPNGASSELLKYTEYKYSSADKLLSGFSEYGRKQAFLLKYKQYGGSEKYLSDMLGASLLQTYLYRMLAKTGYCQSGGAYGYRDQLQDSLAALYFRPELTKYQILRSCARQYSDGRVQHWWHPTVGGLRSRCSDDYMWLPYVTAEYVLSTGDVGILSLKAGFLLSPPLADNEEDRYENPRLSDEKQSVLKHCLRAIEASFSLGEHGLPFMLSGDWNDGMNGVGSMGRGESVWLAFFFAVVYRRFAEMLAFLRSDHSKNVNMLRRKADQLLEAAEKAWDGGWYRRAYDDYGEPLGSAESEECKIDILPQAFSVFAGADRERSVIAMDNLYKLLYDDENGILRLFAPSFDKKTEYGYIAKYPAGIRENGGQYTHAAIWAARAFCALGAYKRGKEIIKRSATPSVIYENGAMNGRYTAEPYLICADIYYGNGITGKSGWSGYTGSAGWYYTTVMKYIFGVEFFLGELTVTPRREAAGGNFSLDFVYNGFSVTLCVSFSEENIGEAFDLTLDAADGETVKVGKITEDIKILLKIRN